MSGGQGLSAFKAHAPCASSNGHAPGRHSPHAGFGVGLFWDTQSGFRSIPVCFQPQRLDLKAAVAAGFEGKKRQ